MSGLRFLADMRGQLQVSGQRWNAALRLSQMLLGEVEDAKPEVDSKKAKTMDAWDLISARGHHDWATKDPEYEKVLRHEDWIRAK